MTTLIWEGIAIVLHHTQNRFGEHFDHIELRANEPLPVTETGYRSHFIPHDELALWPCPEAFVRDWLDEAARDPAWQTYRQNSRPLTLF